MTGARTSGGACGNTKIVSTAKLNNGHVKSCGCLAKTNAVKHNAINTREYITWTNIKARCTNPNNSAYHNYGGRGITVCNRWLDSFENFYEDMGKRPSIEFSIDRIDVNKDYSPENCRWADQKTQMRNRRNTKIVNYKGVEKPLAQFCEELNLELSTITNRIKIGWSVEKAFTTPIKYIKK